jgi:predicted RNA-binding Zn-ribbon protein involved in translation (DUF1610 family)
MTYKETLQAVDTEKALTLIGLEFTAQGQYIKFNCRACQETALIKAYGEKKNLYYCPKCKASGHIISLVMKVKGLDWNGANELLTKAQMTNAKKITEEINLHYELTYNNYLKDRGITEEMCMLYEIGIPKGKTMLAQCVAFAVRDETGMRVAYYGIKMKDGKPIFHKSFNPEQYLYGFHNINPREDVYLYSDIFKCVANSTERQCISNFGLPYLSQYQIALLLDLDKIVFVVDELLAKNFAIQLAQSHRGFYRFEH